MGAEEEGGQREGKTAKNIGENIRNHEMSEIMRRREKPPAAREIALKA